jgi:hypothetical protein
MRRVRVGTRPDGGALTRVLVRAAAIPNRGLGLCWHEEVAFPEVVRRQLRDAGGAHAEARTDAAHRLAHRD